MKHIPGKLAILALLLALIMIVVANTAVPMTVSAVDTGFAVPSSWANIPTRSNFNKPEEGRVSDDSHATGSSLTDSASYYGFGFSIPSDTTIDGIVVTVEGYRSSGADRTFDVSLSYDGGTNWTATKNTGAMTTTDATYTLGGAADNWGYASWTSAILNSNNFRVRLDVAGSGGGNIKVDSVQASIGYSLPATALAVDPATGTYGGTVNLTATLTSGGSPLSGKSIAFTLNGSSVGSATTNGSGVATLNAASLAGISAGTYPTGVGASFAGDAGYGASSDTDSLTVNKANQTIAVTAHGNIRRFLHRHCHRRRLG